MIEIREIKATEYDFLPEILYEAMYVPIGRERPAKSIVNSSLFLAYLENFGRIGDFAFVLIDKNELVGATWTRIFSAGETGYGFVDEKTPELIIALKAKYRNQGFGNLMIQKLFEKLKSENFEQLSLLVDKRNPAVNLYLRLGFETIGEEGKGMTMLKKL